MRKFHESLARGSGPEGAGSGLLTGPVGAGLRWVGLQEGGLGNSVGMRTVGSTQAGFKGGTKRGELYGLGRPWSR